MMYGGGVLIAGLVAGILLTRRSPAGTTMAHLLPRGTDSAIAAAPPGVRIRVRVVNATGRRGLARRATLLLREHGFDVVEYDSERGTALDRTEIVQHRGDADWSARLQRALGVGQPVIRPDSLLDVELTVRLGRDWEPAAEPLRP
jgi:hypothetical protein